MDKIILLGGGGHCKVVIETILLEKKYDVVGIIDLQEKVGQSVSSIPIVGTDEELREYLIKKVDFCFITLGSVGNPNLRIKLFNKAKEIGFKFPNIIHPGSMISKSAKMGEGNYIAAGVIINADSIIGSNCIINTSTVIEHDCKIGDFVHFASGVTLCGGVEIGSFSHIGSGSVVIQHLRIGKNTIIGAGSTVIEDIGDNIVAYGNPCKEIRGNDI